MPKDEKLEQIFEKADDVATVTKNQDDSMEFNFKGGLVFENMAVIENEASDSMPESTPEEVTASEDDEFSLPDSFIIDEKYNTPPTPDTPSTIFRTYVPKFTEVSDTYRMKNDPRPRPKSEPKPAIIKDETAKEEKIDPIAELEIEHEEAVTVKINGKEDKSSDNTLNVFKFAESVSAAMGKKLERTVEDEREEINQLLATKKSEPAPAPKPEPEPEPEKVETPTIVEDEPKSYSIPDPSDDLRVIDYGKPSRETPKYKRVDPEGVSEDAPKGGKKKLGNIEYNSPAERDDIKDAFLDSTLSIKIRLIAMAVIALMMLVFENIIVAPGNNMIGSMLLLPGFFGVIDLAFASAMFLIAMPEVVRAFKYLAIGRIIPEIFLVAAYVVEIAYTLIITFNGTVGQPLLGLLFGIFAIATVLSSHYRVNADFTAFKVVSTNIEKQILDRKLTRTLHDENMALDGAIDEYKSRIARIFHTAFISDFFKRANKVSENSLSVLVPLIISFGAASITAVVNYFFNGGVASAASGFAIVFLLALPAFAVLIHKLPYYDAQMAALDENSTLVGETSYRSFSTVDVVAFDDTDIFGVDDVSLRRIMLYGDKNEMEKAMKEMKSLFAAVGGPLALIFKKTIDRQCHPASDVVIEADGICGIVDGLEISAGTEEYMLRHNIAIPELTNKREMGVDTTRIMYAAENGEVYAKFYIRYSFSEQFTMLIPAIKAEGIVPLIYTRDPNVSNELLKTLCAGSDSMRVMKKYYPITDDEYKVYRRVSAELVTYGNNINTINTVLLTKKYAKFDSQLSGTELYSTLFTAALAAVLAIIGVSSIPVILLSLWQVAWCLVLRIASKRAFPRATLDEDEG